MAVPLKKKKRRSKVEELKNELNSVLKLDRPVMLGSDPYFDIERIPTGSFVMDRITGGGFARGRHYELFGDENAGKSYIVYRTMALAQSRGEVCAIIDPEHSFDAERFEFLGGDANDLLAYHPTNAEEAIAVMMTLARNSRAHDIGVVGMDSVSSLVPDEEMSKDVRDKDQPAGQARMMSRALRRITTVNEKVVFLWTNQERTDIGIKFGNPRVTSGGKALRYYATGRMEFRRGTKVVEKRHVARGGKLVQSEVIAGRWIQVKAEKDKSTYPGREGSFIFNFRMKRIDPASEIVQLGLEDGLIRQDGNGKYTYIDLDDKKWAGTQKVFYKMINSNPELREELEAVIADNSRNGGVNGTDDD
jgi:recombination protein RecA